VPTIDIQQSISMVPTFCVGRAPLASGVERGVASTVERCRVPASRRRNHVVDLTAGRVGLVWINDVNTQQPGRSRTLCASPAVSQLSNIVVHRHCVCTYVHSYIYI